MTVLRNIVLFCFCNVPLILIAETTSKIEKSNLVKPVQVEPFSLMNMLNTVIGLVVVIALILALAWAVRKYGQLPTNSQVDMKILGGLSLGTREKAVLVQVEGKKILLGVAPGRVQTLHVIQNEENAKSDFNKELNDAMENS